MKHFVFIENKQTDICQKEKRIYLHEIDSCSYTLLINTKEVFANIMKTANIQPAGMFFVSKSVRKGLYKIFLEAPEGFWVLCSSLFPGIIILKRMYHYIFSPLLSMISL